MESIRIKNFRSLKDTGHIKLKPITVLVGKNSAGKSTFLRTFPLFKQSVEERTKAPVLFYTRNGVDFGSYKDVKSVFAKDDEYLEFEFLLPKINFKRKFNNSNVNSKLRICMKINSEVDKITPFLKILEVEILKNKIEIHFNKKNIVDKVIINNENIDIGTELAFINDGFIPDKFFVKNKNYRSSFENYVYEKLQDKLENEIENTEISTERFKHIIREISALQSKTKCFQILEKKLDYKKILLEKRKDVKFIDKDSKWFDNFYTWIILSNFEYILNVANIYLGDTFHNVKYIAPIRATAERYYRIQDLSVDEVDANGQNLPMFLGSLSTSMMKKFNIWTEENFYFQVKIKRIEGHYSMKIVYANNFEVNISDMGFGYSQILPIITQLWYSSQNDEERFFSRTRNIPIIFVIEQPELHLHPEFQAKFADVIVKIINGIEKSEIDIKLIIETHSQTIINRLGKNIQKGNFFKDDVNIIIFDKEIEGEATIIKSASFDKDGLLENWPIGFFNPTAI